MSCLDGMAGFVLTAKIGVLKMPANLRDSAQVLLKFGPRVTRSQSLDVRSAKIDAAVDSITSATVDIVRKGAKLGVDPSVLAEMTHLEPQIIADILADDRPEANEAVARDIANRRLAASMNFGSCLAVPVSKLADLDKTKAPKWEAERNLSFSRSWWCLRARRLEMRKSRIGSSCAARLY